MTTPAATSQPSAGEPAAISTPPIQESVPISEPQPTEPAPGEEAEPIEPPASAVDTELSSLRSKAKYVKPRKARRRWPRIVILLLLILLAALVGVYLMLNNLNQAANPPAEATPAEAMLTGPTDTPTPTATPTVTPTPSITPTRYPPTWTPMPTPTAPPTRTPTPLPTFDPAVQTGLLRLRDQVAAVRGLEATADIPTALLPRDLVEPALRSILDIQRAAAGTGESSARTGGAGIDSPGVRSDTLHDQSLCR